MAGVVERIRATADAVLAECDCESCVGYAEGMHAAADMIAND